MVAFTDKQLVNLVGWLNFRTGFIKKKINQAINDPDTRTQARQEARDATLQMMKVLRTIAVRNGFTIPTTEYTDQELKDMGVDPNAS